MLVCLPCFAFAGTTCILQNTGVINVSPLQEDWDWIFKLRWTLKKGTFNHDNFVVVPENWYKKELFCILLFLDKRIVFHEHIFLIYVSTSAILATPSLVVL